jgi:hypothetical protein
MASAHISRTDRRRYYDWKSGMGLPELATKYRVPQSTIERSIQVCRAEAQQFSQEAAEVEVRRTVLELLPKASTAISDALTATKKETVAVIIEGEIMKETVDVPDHTTRLRGNSAVIELLSAIKVSAPMVSVDARTQTQNVLGLPAHASGQPTSAEAVIREIRAARGLALTDGVVQGSTENPVALVEVDEELADELEEDDEDEEPEEQDDDAEPEEEEPESGGTPQKESELDEDWG